MAGLRIICLQVLIICTAVIRLSAGSRVSKFHPTPQKEVIDKLLTADYDVNEWPDADDGKATNIYMQMFINSFGSLNAANMDYSVDVFLRQRWHDQRLAYNDTRKQITITADEYRKRIWKPDTYFENVKEASLHQVTMPNILLRITREGDILYSMRVTVKLGCPLQLGNFPFDQQICKTAFASYAYTDDVIKYFWHNDTPIDLPDTLEIAQFDLMDQQVDSFTYKFATGDFSGVNVSFTLRRQNGYHVLQTYVPTILIVSISWVSFWLDPNAVPARVSLGVTTLLTLTTLASGIRATLPPVSYVKAIDVWIGICMFMVFGALLEFTFVNWLANRKVSDPTKVTSMFNMSKTFAKASGEASESGNQEEDDTDNDGDEKENQVELLASGSSGTPPTTFINAARTVDYVCRAAFPGFFLVFNLFYWPYYLFNQQSDTLQ